MYSIKIITLVLTYCILLKCAGTSDLGSMDIKSAKTSPTLKRFLLEKGIGDEEIFILSSYSLDSLQARIHAEKNNIKVLQINIPTQSMKIACKIKYLLERVLAWHEVIYADKYISPTEEIIISGYDRKFHGINFIDNTIPDVNGKNIIVGVKERKMDEKDIDLVKRVLPSPLSSIEISDHATQIASLIGGAGNSYYTGRGIASACNFYSSSFDNLFADDLIALTSNKISVQNHSYGTIIQNFYGAEAVSYDMQTWQNKELLHVFSAGNSGDQIASDGKYKIQGYANTTANFKSAKNVLLVGAVDNTSILSSKSSSGPLYDGRLAPHLVALGPNGTSDAAAIVSGTAAAMQQVYANKTNGPIPPAALIKAILLNTADDIHTTGIDYKSGYGILNSRAAIETILNNDFVSGMALSNKVWDTTLNIADTIKTLRISLSWTDSTASINNAMALINDLDLIVEDEKSGTIYLPWCLNTSPSKDSLEKLPIRKRDSLNTIEQITIDNPKGRYKIRVKNNSLPSGVLPFYIALKKEYINSFIFTSPVHSSDITKSDTFITLKWAATLTDETQKGNLFVSYDQGNTWTLIENNIALKNGIYNWKVKDTSSVLMFTMQTPFGRFKTKSIILEKDLNLRLEYSCSDSFKISWSPYIYALGYSLYALTDSPYLKKIATLSDTAVVIKKSNFPFTIFAVQPILAIDASPVRSKALSILNQRIFCYYKTFYFNPLDGNKLDLVLELSTANHIDSVIFEQVSQDGRLVKEIKKTMFFQNKVVTALTHELPKGISYFRCRIKLKKGGHAYTDIISTVTSGKDNFLIYPNPLKQYSRLHYVLRQGLSQDINLELFDLCGKLVLELKSISNDLELPGLGAGLYFYRVTDIENKEITTGKIMIL